MSMWKLRELLFEREALGMYMLALSHLQCHWRNVHFRTK